MRPQSPKKKTLNDRVGQKFNWKHQNKNTPTILDTQKKALKVQLGTIRIRLMHP